jgi:hypothetical protein
MQRALPLVALAAVLVTAGCLSSVGPGSPTPETPDDRAETPTPHQTPSGECEAVERETVDPFRDDVEPSPIPDRPEELTADSVESYVAEFEKSYARNGALFEDSRRVNTLVVVENVTRREGVWVVDLVSRTNTWAQGTATGTATATVVHGDGARISVRYHLTADGLYRLELGYDETPVPGKYGVPVACFE